MFITRNIDVKVKNNLLKASITLYGSETWVKQKKKRLVTFETRCYRRMLRIHWTEHITNEDVFRRVGTTRSLLKDLESQVNWTHTVP